MLGDAEKRQITPPRVSAGGAVKRLCRRSHRGWASIPTSDADAAAASTDPQHRSTSASLHPPLPLTASTVASPPSFCSVVVSRHSAWLPLSDISSPSSSSSTPSSFPSSFSSSSLSPLLSLPAATLSPATSVLSVCSSVVHVCVAESVHRGLRCGADPRCLAVLRVVSERGAAAGGAAEEGLHSLRRPTSQQLRSQSAAAALHLQQPTRAGPLHCAGGDQPQSTGHACSLHSHSRHLHLTHRTHHHSQPTHTTARREAGRIQRTTVMGSRFRLLASSPRPLSAPPLPSLLPFSRFALLSVATSPPLGVRGRPFSSSSTPRSVGAHCTALHCSAPHCCTHLHPTLHQTGASDMWRGYSATHFVRTGKADLARTSWTLHMDTA